MVFLQLSRAKKSGAEEYPPRNEHIPSLLNTMSLFPRSSMWSFSGGQFCWVLLRHVSNFIQILSKWRTTVVTWRGPRTSHARIVYQQLVQKTPHGGIWEKVPRSNGELPLQGAIHMGPTEVRKETEDRIDNSIVPADWAVWTSINPNSHYCHIQPNSTQFDRYFHIFPYTRG